MLDVSPALTFHLNLQPSEVGAMSLRMLTRYLIFMKDRREAQRGP